MLSTISCCVSGGCSNAGNKLVYSLMSTMSRSPAHNSPDEVAGMDQGGLPSVIKGLGKGANRLELSPWLEEHVHEICIPHHYQPCCGTRYDNTMHGTQVCAMLFPPSFLSSFLSSLPPFSPSFLFFLLSPPPLHFLFLL